MGNERFRPSENADPSQRRQPDILARLEQAVGAIQDSETFRAYLDVQARFHHYSPGNAALILAQRPDAAQVAGYNAWLRMHRFVRRGEKAIKIIVPMTKKVETDAGEEERKLIFGTGNVFDVSQTDGEPLPEIAVPTLEGAEGAGLLQQLHELAQAEGLDVRTVPAEQMPSDTMMGFYEGERRAIAVREAAPLQMAKTLAHELGHHFAGHSRSDPESETVAEAIAYVVCGHFGLDTGERSFPYIATWAQDKKVLQQALGTIQRVSAAIIDRLAPQLEQPEEPAPMAGGAPMKRYHGYSEDADSAMGPEVVFVQEDEQMPYRLKHEVRHSPDGFSWGYGGSGPADLARSILADHLGFMPHPAIYQRFKAAHVARWEQGRSWQITSEEIDAFLAQPEMQVLLAEQRELDRLRRDIEELQRLEQHEQAGNLSTLIPNRQPGEPKLSEVCPVCGAPDAWYCTCGT